MKFFFNNTIFNCLQARDLGSQHLFNKIHTTLALIGCIDVLDQLSLLHRGLFHLSSRLGNGERGNKARGRFCSLSPFFRHFSTEESSFCETTNLQLNSLLCSDPVFTNMIRPSRFIRETYLDLNSLHTRR